LRREKNDGHATRQGQMTGCGGAAIARSKSGGNEESNPQPGRGGSEAIGKSNWSTGERSGKRESGLGPRQTEKRGGRYVNRGKGDGNAVGEYSEAIRILKQGSTTL